MKTTLAIHQWEKWCHRSGPRFRWLAEFVTSHCTSFTSFICDNASWLDEIHEIDRERRMWVACAEPFQVCCVRMRLVVERAFICCVRHAPFSFRFLGASVRALLCAALATREKVARSPNKRAKRKKVSASGCNLEARIPPAVYAHRALCLTFVGGALCTSSQSVSGWRHQGAETDKPC